jgi:hypothetical protein
MLTSLASGASAVELQEGNRIKCAGNLLLEVGRIEPIKTGESGIHVQMFHKDEVFAAHLPFSDAALKGCKPVENNSQPSFERESFLGGFETWSKEEGGIFSISPREVKKLIEQLMADQ